MAAGTDDRRSRNTSNDKHFIETCAEIFRCFICMGKLDDAQLCPHCSKLCCFACVNRCLTEQSPQCPHCRAPLVLQELVKCRWVEELTLQMQAMQHEGTRSAKDKLGDRCPTHQEMLSVYCETCRSSICHQCALWSGVHSGHSFKPLEDVYEQHVNQIQDEVAQLRGRLMKHTCLLQDLVRNMKSIRSAVNERVCERSTAVASMAFSTIEAMIAPLVSELNANVHTLMGQRSSLTLEKELLEHLIEAIEHQLEDCSKSELITRYHDLLKMIHEGRKNPIALFVPASVPADFYSGITTGKDSSLIYLDGFTALLHRADPVFSAPFNVDGKLWRLKLYPEVNGVVSANSAQSINEKAGQFTLLLENRLKRKLSQLLRLLTVLSLC